MKTLFLFFCSLIALLSHSQQKENVVEWNFSSKKVSANSFEIHLTATIYEGWHIYAQVQPKDAIAAPTKISLSKNPLITVTGKPKEIAKKEKQEVEVLDITQYFYSGKVDFVLTITLKSKAKTNITGTVEYMACTDERCLPPKTERFSVAIGL